MGIAYAEGGNPAPLLTQHQTGHEARPEVVHPYVESIVERGTVVEVVRADADTTSPEVLVVGTEREAALRLIHPLVGLYL